MSVLMTASELKTYLTNKKAAARFSLPRYDPDAWALACMAEKIEEFKRGSACAGEFCHTLDLAQRVTRLAQSLGYVTSLTTEGTGARIVISPDVLTHQTEE